MTKLFTAFFNSEKAGGLILVISTIVSLAIANSPLQTHYIHFWEMDLGGDSLD